MNTYLLLPAFNEAESLRELLPKVSALEIDGLEVVVLDDGSTDDTFRVAHDSEGVVALRHPRNMGLGAALSDLLLHALDRALDDDAVAVMDADNSMNPDVLPDLIDALHSDVDIVIASRYRGMRQRGVPWWRAVLSRGARVVVQGLFKVPGVRDVTCGYRVYRASVLRSVLARYGTLVDGAGFTASTELLLKAAGVGAAIVERPFRLRYDLKRGPSKMPLMRTLAGYVRLLWAMRAMYQQPRVVRTPVSRSGASNAHFKPSKHSLRPRQ